MPRYEEDRQIEIEKNRKMAEDLKVLVFDLSHSLSLSLSQIVQTLMKR